MRLDSFAPDEASFDLLWSLPRFANFLRLEHRAARPPKSGKVAGHAPGTCEVRLALHRGSVRAISPVSAFRNHREARESWPGG